MTAIPIIPESAPFSPEQRSWLNGFLAGVLSKGTAAGAAAPAAAAKNLLIAFGSQSGNAEGLAKRLSKTANSRGFAARAAGLDALKPADLTAAGNVLVITSTWGEGEMPDNAAGFWDQLNQNGSSPDLKGVKYSVLALGDRNYGETFCLAGRKLDERLTELGAQRVTDRVECDVDFDDLAASWSTAALAALAGEEAAAPEAATTGEEPEETGYGRKNPFPAALLANDKLNGPGSAKDTRHISFSLAGSGLTYEAGDALAVQPVNHPAVVDRVIADWQLDPATPVDLPSGGVGPLREALLHFYEVRHLLGQPVATPGDAPGLLGSLRRLQPRLYSIASSPKAHPDEVQLCIGVVRYEVDGIAHEGVTSTFLADRLALGGTTGVYVQGAKHFRLPADRTKPVIMVGPGTGIAPFRAFLEEREATGSPGKNWLFFGDQKSECDFLYQAQITGWAERGVLHRLDTAFSRDQQEKIYVQTRMRQAAAELWQWLEEGAYFYVCGDAKRMAKDVDEALHEIISSAGGLSPEAATAYVAQLKKDKRYARDVY